MYRLIILAKHPKGWIEGEIVYSKTFDLIDNAKAELDRILGHQIGRGAVLLIQIVKED